MINTSRRDFLGLLGLAGGAFAAPAGFCAAIAPERRLRLGVISDVHLQFEHAYGELWKLERALSWFREEQVDAVVIPGDIAENGLISEMEAFAKVWYGFFPEDRLDGRKKVERLFIFGNHDANVVWRIPKMFPNDEEAQKKAILKYNAEAAWKRCFNEEWKPWYEKEVNGYTFLCSHWRPSGKNVDEFLELPEYLKANAAKLGKTKPFFVVKHSHPVSTCHGKDALWCHDRGVGTTNALKDFPNAVCLSGHSHTTLTDEKAVWQDSFTSIGCSSLCYATHGRFRSYARPPEDHPWGITTKDMGGDCHHGMMIDVHDGFLTVRRREFKYNRPLGEDWIVPVPATPENAITFKKRAAAKHPPAYKTAPKVEVKDTDKGQTLVFAAVPQGDKAFTRVIGYDVIATNKDDKVKPLTFTFTTAGFLMPVELEPSTVLFDVPAGTFKNPADWTFKVVPFDSFDTRAV